MAGGLTITVLADALRKAEPAALLVEPRILRRVIRLDRRLAGLGFFVPHRKCYTIDRGRLLAFVDRGELELPASAELPRRVILLAKPADDDALHQMQPQQALAYYERLLFHARVHLELERRMAEQPSAVELAAKRREQIGETTFAEIRAVLLKDGFLFPQPGDLDTYTEFAAVYLELHYFAPAELPDWFPSIHDFSRIEPIISQDIYHAQVFEGGRLTAPRPAEMAAEAPPANALEDSIVVAPSPSRVRRLSARARRVAALGNSVKAAILGVKAAAYEPGENRWPAMTTARGQLHTLTDRLQPVLQLSDAEAEQWREVLTALLEPAARGFWSIEARLLYDLQKVCVERERGIYKLDVVRWSASLVANLGRRAVNLLHKIKLAPWKLALRKVALRRPLPLLREVLIVKHLRTAQRRLGTARLSPELRDKLSGLLSASVARAEHDVRERLRPLIVEVLDEAELIPQNVPERVARRKLIEELLDRVVEQGFFNMGSFRDSLSRNDLKLPDLSGPVELLRGDRLLNADHRLGDALDGVYRRGTIYLRWPQRLSSLAFGTSLGRSITQYVVLPFGGAWLALEFLKHLAGWFVPVPPRVTLPDGSLERPLPMEIIPSPVLYSAVFLLGIWLLLLLHSAAFRARCVEVLSAIWKGTKRLVLDLPRSIVQSSLVQRALASTTYAAMRSYLMRPALVTLLLAMPAILARRPWSPGVTLNVFLAAALFLNSPIGRYADEWLTDFLGRAWYDLRMRVFAAAFQVIAETFHQLMVALERVVYTVDEWLRFRSGDSTPSRGVKLIAGAGWFVISYVILFVFTLLVEPQINPIKHFPVVTVSHKLILPSGPFFVKQLTPYLGAGMSAALVGSTIWLIPGVFGFLAWELKENWRLYAANRRRQLGALHIGHHGETMAGLLRVGFHSGTLPKKFAALRKAIRRARRSGDTHRVGRRRDDLHRVETAVRNFVERELIGLCEEARLAAPGSMQVGEVRLATNRIEVELFGGSAESDAAWVAWEEADGRLTAIVEPAGWLEALPTAQRDELTTALSGLFQRSGAEQVAGATTASVAPPFSWEEWLAFWQDRPAIMALKVLHPAAATPSSRAG